jgi:uncharacterized protein YpuA (DUF1002 family)
MGRTKKEREKKMSNAEIISEITRSVLMVALILISAYFIPWLKNYIGEDKYETIIEFAEIVVRSAEKMYTVEEWAQKKAYAVNMVSNKAKQMGVDINEKEINAIIEGAVQAVKG